MQPYEIVAHPLTVYLAPVGTAFPAVDATPAVAWQRLGAGLENYGDDGVTVSHPQTVEKWRGQSVQPVKAFRTEEDLIIAFTLHDVSAATYARILNDATVTQTAAGVGTPGTSAFPLARGSSIATYALLARGKSPANNDLTAQYQVPYCYPDGEPEVVYQKGEPAGLEFELHALVDRNATSERERFGRLVIQTAPAG